MSTIVVSHGFEARSDSVWFPWFTAASTALGHQVVIPDLPEPGAPHLEPWRATLAAAATAADPADTVLVGHSIGSVNVLRMLEQHAGTPFAGAVLVSASAHEVGYDILAEFFDGPFDWPRIRAAATDFRLLSAIDDPVNAADPMGHVQQLVRGLGARALVLPSGGHLGAHPDDHIELPEAVALVEEILAQRD
ncbi:alpha/beta fold hydrolase [Nocardia sp. NPDC059177]|uniref:alpha/beta fold hydrolase n=1 Tax=Nocardia sp. NPDC059177 TaxID=3346759 RepID=UPI00368CB315